MLKFDLYARLLLTIVEVWFVHIKSETGGIPLTGLTPTHVCVCPKPAPGFPMLYVIVFFSVQWFEVRGTVVVRFVDIGAIINHYFVLLCEFKREGRARYFFSTTWKVYLKLFLFFHLLNTLFFKHFFNLQNYHHTM